MNDSDSTSSHSWLARFAKLVVVLTFALILIGGHTTTAGAGMAFPDWPLSSGSLNPHGWWDDVFQRLEHGHRLMAETVGLMIGILCAWLWSRLWAVPASFLVAVGAAVTAWAIGAGRPAVVLTALAALVVSFLGMLFFSPQKVPSPYSPGLRWLGLAAFFGVCIQAVLGGLRVTIESGGSPDTAIAFRVFHGCVAQAELCVLVCIAALLSPVWRRMEWRPEFVKVSRLAWITAGVIGLQLVAGATMRHLGAGLAIQTFPAATPEGRWMPAVHNTFVDLNFTHTRMGALVLTVLILCLAWKALRVAEVRVQRPAMLMILLLIGQVTLGIFVIWKQRHPMVTTGHVLNGAALLAATVLLAVRTTRRPVQSRVSGESARPEPTKEVEA